MSETTLPQGTIEYREAGPESAAAPTVVFVHGFLVDGSLWAKTADALAARGVRSLAPTWPLGSHRRPMHPDADLSPRGVARIIAAFLEAHDLRDVTLVGNDTGGAICQFLLDEDASRIGRLVLTNCDAFDQFPPAPFDKMFKAMVPPGAVLPLMQPMRSERLRHGKLGFGDLVVRPLDAEQTRGWVEPCLTDAAIRRDTRKLVSGVRPADLVDVATRLPGFDRPVLLTWAPADPFFTMDLAHRLRDTFADARLVEIEDAKTFVPHDQPERLAAEIAAFQGQAEAAGTSSAGSAPAGIEPETVNSRSAS